MTSDLEWYSGLSQQRELLPRCPFASVHRCPRFYQSISLMGEAGSTKINPEEDQRLLEQWRRFDVSPATGEQATSISGGSAGNPNHFWNFCPEVSYEAFGIFASSLDRYVDEIDLQAAHNRLARENASRGDWRWTWWSISPMHYSDCPLYSLLQAGSRDVKPSRDIGF